MHQLSKILGNQELLERLGTSPTASPAVLAALHALGEQAVRMGIDYKSLGLGFNHPKSRLQYRQAQHPSVTCFASRQRAEASRQRLQELVAAIVSGSVVAEAAIVDTFLLEIGVPSQSSVAATATFAGVSAALEAELLLPLRALQEGQRCMHQTLAGEPIPAAEIARTVQDVIAATLSKVGGFSEWRYSNPAGFQQLRGLSREQLEIWKEPTSCQHSAGLQTNEDEDGELGFFWATKIGGPSHGFDFAGQCFLSLLANARNKVVLVKDPAWPAYPAGRAHLRLLWTCPDASLPAAPRLWLEAVNCDFDAKASGIDHFALVRAALCHAIEKAEAMKVPLSVDPDLAQALVAAGGDQGATGNVQPVCESLVLRPSNGVCEASDFLSARHDWVQLHEEVTEPLSRALYVPASFKSRRGNRRSRGGACF